MRLTATLAAAALLAAPAALAHADVFTLTGGSTTITFNIASSPTVSGTNSACGITFGYSGFCVDGNGYSINGVQHTGDFTFFSKTSSGGLDLIDDQTGDNVVDQSGPQLYTGTVNNPTFKLGNFALSSYGAADFSQDFNLNIASGTPITSTPEPSSLILLGTGLLSATGLIRRRFAR